MSFIGERFRQISFSARNGYSKYNQLVFLELIVVLIMQHEKLWYTLGCTLLYLMCTTIIIGSLRLNYEIIREASVEIFFVFCRNQLCVIVFKT